MEVSDLPPNTAGLMLCRMEGDNLRLCRPVVFVRGAVAVETALRRASISGRVGPLGEINGDWWADLIDEHEDTVGEITLSEGAWKALKNRWARTTYWRDAA